MPADPRPRPLPFRLLAIGGRREATSAAVRALAEAGGREVALLLRDRDLSPPELFEWVTAVIPVCRPAGVLVLVHGSPEVARAASADGVHLPELASVAAARSMLGADAWVGASRHDAAGVRAVAAAGGDYATLSPVFPTPRKGEPLGLANFAGIVGGCAVPVVALGGVSAANAADCRAAGAAAVAAIRGVWVGDVRQNVKALLEPFDAAGWRTG